MSSDEHDRLNDPAWLHEQWFTRARTLTDIAAELGVSRLAVDDALREHGLRLPRLRRPPPPPRTRPPRAKTPRRRAEPPRKQGLKPRPVDPELLRRLYVDERLSLDAVAERLGIGATTVRRRLERLGIPRRPTNQPRPRADDDEVRRLYVDEGLGVAAIAARLGRR